MGDLDAQTRDAIRDLCEAVAILAHGTVHLIGTNSAAIVIGKTHRLAERMDLLDEEATDG
jgi:hypothetical protein